jgi:hypothetical protein
MVFTVTGQYTIHNALPKVLQLLSLESIQQPTISDAKEELLKINNSSTIVFIAGTSTIPGLAVAFGGSNQ